MSNSFEYEIARYSVQGEAELLIESAQLCDRAGALWRRVGVEPEIPCPAGDLSALISADPLLSEVRANQVTRITAKPAALLELPLVLSAPGDSSDFDQSLWSQTMVREHLDSSDGTDGRGVYRVLYVNDARWGVFTTPEGERLLPEGGDSQQLPLLDPCWGELSFSEGGATMTVGGDVTAIGLVTPGVVASTTTPDEDDIEISLMRRGDDADTFIDWLVNGTMLERYSTVNPFIGEMMAKLFVEASIGGHNGQVIAGSLLAAGKEIDEDSAMCAHDTSDWCLRLNLEAAMIDRVLDILTRCDRGLSEIAKRRALESESPSDQDPRAAAHAPATGPSNPSRGKEVQVSRSVEKAARAVQDVVGAATDDAVSKPVSRRMLCDDLSDCPNGNEHRLSVWATYTAADGLTVEGSDSTEWPCDDLEYTYQVAPEHIGHLRAALGAVDDDDLLELLKQRMPTLRVDGWLKKHGVQYTGSETRHPN